jgi:hypothetical protein
MLSKTPASSSSGTHLSRQAFVFTVSSSRPDRLKNSSMQRVITILFWLSVGLALAGASIASLPLPGDPGDKFKHVLAFGVLASLAALAYPRIRVLTLWVLLSAFAGLLELLQFAPFLHRSPDWIDFAIGVLASGMALAVMALWRRSAELAPL